jgi:hypothetical protein
MRTRAGAENRFNGEIDHLVERLGPAQFPGRVEPLVPHGLACRRNGRSKTLTIQLEQHRAHALTPSFGSTE